MKQAMIGPPAIAPASNSTSRSALSMLRELVNESCFPYRNSTLAYSVGLNDAEITLPSPEPYLEVNTTITE